MTSFSSPFLYAVYIGKGKGIKKMTDEKLKENSKQTMIKKETQAVMEKPIPFIRGKRLSRKKSQIQNMISPGIGFLIGFLFGGAKFPLDTYPLGCALVSALPRNAVAALLGVLVRTGYLYLKSEEVLLPIICSASLLVCRVVLNIIIFGKSNLSRLRRLPDTVSMKMLLCAVFVLGISLVDVVYAGANLYRILRAVLSTVVSVAFTLLFSFFFDEEYRHHPVFEAGFGALCFSLTLGSLSFAIGDFSVGLAVAFATTLYAGFLGVPTRSASIGLLCGTVSGGFFGPVFALAGLVAGIFSDSYVFFGGIGAFLVTVCSALYFGTAESIMEIFPELSCSAVLVTFCAMFKLLPRDRFPEFAFIPEKENTAAVLWTKHCEAEMEKRMLGLSKAMDSLSCMVQGLSERFRRPNPEKLTENSLTIWESYCRDCPNENSCKGISELESEKISAKLSSGLLSGMKMDRERLYEITRIRCPHLDALALEMNALSSKMIEDAIRDDKTKVFALDYGIMSEIFADIAVHAKEKNPADKTLSERLRKAFYREGLRAEHVLVCGDRKKTVIVTGETIARTELHSREIRSICESVCGVQFGEPRFILEDGKSAFILETLPLYHVEAVMKQVPKKGEIVCGDSVATALGGEDYFYCFLCDGMGSGEEAALTSKLCRVFLEKMLVCGNPKSTTLEMLNHLLCSRNTECFATVDICEIDLMLGVASFLKSGAIPSFIMRDGHLYKISGGSFPIGILSQVSAEYTDFELCHGDVIVLCSDGIVSDADALDGEDTARFSDLLVREWTDDLEALAEKVLTYSSDFSVRMDDMSVAFLRITKINDSRS